MSDIVFILGAGASKQCGAPLMADFLDVAMRLHRAGQVKDKSEHYDRVFRAIGALQSVHSKAQLDLNNIESIFTALEISKILNKLPNFDHNEIIDVIASLKEVIVKTLESTINFPVEKGHILTPKPYGQFADLIKYLTKDAFPKNTVSVITFNYDISADMALFRAGLGPDYGIPPDPISHSPIQLLKLHGSLNWASQKNGQGVYPLQLNQYFSKYTYNGFDEHATCKIPIGSHLKDYFAKFTDVEIDDEPVIVPPTWNKADHHQALSSIWGKAAKNLSEAKSIFIIGYSLPETDAFFRLLYALGTVGPAPLEKIMVYNPDHTGEVDGRFRQILGPGAIARYEYKEMRFDEALTNIKGLFPTRN